jgi:hypothetical protein
MNHNLLKITGIIIFLLIFSLSSNAQKEGKNGIRFGLHSAQLKMEKEDFYDKNNKSVYVGLFREERFLGLLKWRTGLEYHESGSREDADNFLKIGYVTVPASIGVKLGPLQAFGGASAGLKVFTNETINGEKSDPTINDYDSFNATAFLGGVFKVAFIGIELQYHWGLTNVTEDFRNRYFELGLRFYL